MKKSINKKIFATFTLLIITTILTLWLLNTLVLEKYYVSVKESTIEDVFNLVNNYFNTSNEDTTESTLEEKLENLNTNRNIDIVIRNGSNVTIYSTSKDFLNNKFLISSLGIHFEIDPAKVASSLKNGEKYSIQKSFDGKTGSDFIGLYGILDNGYVIFIRTPIQSIRESVSISNTFLIFVGITCIMVSSLISFLLSRHLTKPLVELDEIASNMSKLDFSKKYKVESNDEIGRLGTSINTLSDNLEKTIKELKETNIDLEKDIEEKSKLDEMRSKFISDVSHELKTPIALIQGYAEGLVDNVITDEENKKYYAEVILDEANKMSELTKDLLDLSKLEYGLYSLSIQTFNIVETIKDTIKKNKLLFDEKNINVDFNEDKEVLVKGDVFRIEQVLTNYITNAIKNVDDKKIIKINIEEHENKIKVSVFNTGKQIDIEDIPRIWNRFYKIDTARSREMGGTGLGLSVVKAIMNQHKNDFGVENVENGVNFWFELNK